MRQFSRRRGLGTVVTTAIMLSAVAVMGTGVIAWSSGNLKNHEIDLTSTASNNTNKINENIKIENIVFCSTCNPSPHANNVINVTLTNIGTVGSTITKIQINDTVISQFTNSTTLPVNIMPTNSYTVATKLPSNVVWHSKSVDTITVTTARGSIYTTQAAPP